MIRKAIIWVLVAVGTCSIIQMSSAQGLPDRFRRDEDRLGIVSRFQDAEKSRNQMANQLSTQKRLIENLSERLENLLQSDTKSLESRLDKRDEQLMEGIFERFKKDQLSQPDQEKIAEGIFRRWRESTEVETEESRQLLKFLRKSSVENEKLGKRLGDFKPLQGVIDRGQQLVWKIFWLAISVIIVLVVLGAILGFLYIRAKARLAEFAIKLP